MSLSCFCSISGTVSGPYGLFLPQTERQLPSKQFYNTTPHSHVGVRVLKIKWQSFSERKFCKISFHLVISIWMHLMSDIKKRIIKSKIINSTSWEERRKLRMRELAHNNSTTCILDNCSADSSYYQQCLQPSQILSMENCSIKGWFGSLKITQQNKIVTTSTYKYNEQ